MTSAASSVKRKDSGVPWIGTMPEHWLLRRYKYVFKERDERSKTGEETLLSVSAYTGVSPRAGQVDDGELEHRAATLVGYKICRAGDLVMNIMLAWNRAQGISGFDGIVSPAYGVFEVTGNVDRRFLDYLVRCDTTAAYFKAWSYGIIESRLRLYPETFGSLFCALPPKEEQVAIANHLDHATARIDALVAKKTRFIELLRERRQALITRAVVKGLGEGKAMKDSGVEWLGDVPAHWSVSKLAYVVREQGGKTPTTTVDAFWNGDIPWITPKDMKSSEMTGSIDKISEVAISGFGMTLLAPNAILVVVRGMILAHSFPVAELKVPATINQDMKALIPVKELLPKYLRLLLESYKEYVVSMAVAEAAHGTRVLRTEVWRLLPVLLPPYDEQQDIVAQLDRATARIDTLVAKTERSIELLREHRTALITAAVTGKTDLRGAA